MRRKEHDVASEEFKTFEWLDCFQCPDGKGGQHATIWMVELSKLPARSSRYRNTKKRGTQVRDKDAPNVNKDLKSAKMKVKIAVNSTPPGGAQEGQNQAQTCGNDKQYEPRGRTVARRQKYKGGLRPTREHEKLEARAQRKSRKRVNSR